MHQKNDGGVKAPAWLLPTYSAGHHQPRGAQRGADRGRSAERWGSGARELLKTIVQEQILLQI
jgi:hypothetical protein